MKPIDQMWIKKYVDRLLALAAELPEESPMRQIILLRADHVMDLVKEWNDKAMIHT
jgi:hypothetical protein